MLPDEPEYLRQKAEAKEKLKSQLPKNQLGRGVGSMEWHAEQLAARKEREMNHAARSDALSLAGKPSG